MFVCHVTKRTQIKIKTFTTFPSHSLYASLFTIIAYNIRMPNAYWCIIEYTQIIFILIANAIICTWARVPLDNDCFLGRSFTPEFSYFRYCSTVAFAIVLIPPLPIKWLKNLLLIHYNRFLYLCFLFTSQDLSQL